MTEATNASQLASGAQQGTGTAEDGWYKLENFDSSGNKFPKRARLNGEWILVFNAKDGLRGVERACPHLQATLQDAVLMAGGTVLRCRQHNFTFKLSNGLGVSPPNTQLRVFDIRVVDGIGYGRPGAGNCPLKTGTAADGHCRVGEP